MERSLDGQIDGWGSDLERKNRPGVPMWKRPLEGTGAHWLRPSPQELKFKEFHSIDRPGMTSVFGTSVPPKGLSGLIRHFAYKLSEGDRAHWISLIVADRVNVVEGVIGDLINGHIPDLYQEMGMGAEFKYNPKGIRRKLLAAGIISLGVPLLISWRRIRRDTISK